MGGGNYSDAYYSTRSASLNKDHGTTFTHTKDIKENKVEAKCHPRLDVSGGKIREARDSADHPQSTPIGILFDVTGSMRTLPEMFQKKMATLLNLLVKKNVVPDPQILFGAVGDAAHDNVPLQIGQFESDNRMDEDLSMIYLEGNGGGNMIESYDLGMYYFAYRVVTDNYEKRKKKGYLFVIGDEMLAETVLRRQVEATMGNPPEADMTIKEVIKELSKKWEVFVIRPSGSHHYDNNDVHAQWVNYFGENVYRLAEPDKLCETIAMRLGLATGKYKNEAAAKKALAEVHAETEAVVAEAAKAVKAPEPVGAKRM